MKKLTAETIAERIVMDIDSDDENDIIELQEVNKDHQKTLTPVQILHKNYIEIGNEAGLGNNISVSNLHSQISEGSQNVR